MRSLFVFFLLLAIKATSRVFYRHEVAWVGDAPEERWKGLRLVALLNHTSLFELLYLGDAPLRLLWAIASRGVIPAAQKTVERPLVGLLYRLVASQVVSITRERDHTWSALLGAIRPDGLVVMAPEGRMMRETGLDATGRQMSIRGGIADVLHALGSGGFLIAYSGGLHHVQVPGRFPRAFKTVRLRLERIDIAAYVKSLGEGLDADAFKRAMKDDLQRRRELYCS
ncbi:MAG: hypothetical protein IPN83_24170 [Holophagales bacterium]|nr:hypothetical protein [Holophagales bacterium]